MEQLILKEAIKEIVEDNNLIVKYKECIKYLNLAIKEGIIDLRMTSVYIFLQIVNQIHIYKWKCCFSILCKSCILDI
ncbi:hypothetical protein [Caldicellulosiruptor acetigenus]|uniref:hypothetical protein n=1 Tax=Caldicellulosiruptor acetigenus TaxID=301953 RepID=UPI001E30291A|nr:hypothetical protein [Caldicellulosiruptor acetigenus]WAM36036.1 hypothetical protein OTK01_002418 [Caldicellulosiruptor acetigenus]